MSLLLFIAVVLILVGLLIYATQAYLPVNPTFKNLICFVLVLIGVVAVGQKAGVF